jgi:serine phosphatase RsbU (regulator of sigma subunit)
MRVVQKIVCAALMGVTFSAGSTAPLREHMNRLEQSALLLELTESLSTVKTNDPGAYATAVVVGFDSTCSDLTVTNAGHPPPLWYRAAQREWKLLEKPDSSAPGRPVGLPMAWSSTRRTRTSS